MGPGGPAPTSPETQKEGASPAPTPAFIVTGREDPIFPLDAVREGFATIKAIYAATDAADACVLIEGDGGHRFYADAAWPAFMRYFPPDPD